MLLTQGLAEPAHRSVGRSSRLAPKLQPTALANGGNRFEAVAYRLMDRWCFFKRAMGALPRTARRNAPGPAGARQHYGPGADGGKRLSARASGRQSLYLEP